MRELITLILRSMRPTTAAILGALIAGTVVLLIGLV